MIAGHFATALVPYELTQKSDPVPFWRFGPIYTRIAQ